MPRGATGGAIGRSGHALYCPAVPEASGGRSGADRGAGGGAASAGISRAAGCAASATGSCFGLGGRRDAARRQGSFGRCMFRPRFPLFRRCGARRSVRFPGQPALDLYRYGFIDRAGVGFLFGDAQLREHVEDHVRFHLELACQLVNSNFDHTVCPAVQFRHRGCQIKPCSLSRASAPAGDSAISIVTDCSCGASAVTAASAGAGTASAGVASASPPDSNWP